MLSNYIYSKYIINKSYNYNVNVTNILYKNYNKIFTFI